MGHEVFWGVQKVRKETDRTSNSVLSGKARIQGFVDTWASLNTRSDDSGLYLLL